MDEFAKSVLAQGGLAVIATVFMLTTVKLYRDLRALEERYISKAEKWVEQSFELQMATNELIATVKQLQLTQGD